MVPGRHAGQLSHLNWMTCVNKRTGYNMMKTERSYKSGQCYVSSLTGQTGQVWLPELVPASHTRRCWPEDQRGQRSAGWPPWPPSLPGRHTAGWWTHTGTVHQHEDKVISKKVNSLEKCSVKLQTRLSKYCVLLVPLVPDCPGQFVCASPLWPLPRSVPGPELWPGQSLENQACIERHVT